MLSIPEYYRKYIDSTVDLEREPKQCCPFHKENTPSFSYDARNGIWRCFGACHYGGDVIKLHMKNRGFSSRDAAIRNLIELEPRYVEELKEMIKGVNEVKVDLLNTPSIIETKVKTPEQMVEVDRIMNIYPVQEERLIKFYER